MAWPIALPTPDDLPPVAPAVDVPPAAPVEAPTQRDVREGIEVEWRIQRYSPQSGRAVFTGGVTARYGPTVLRAEELELDYAAKRGWARGKVVVEDPEGRLVAEELEFDWAKGTGVAQRVEIVVDHVLFRAARLTVEPGRWTLDDVFATPSRDRPPDIALRARRLTFRPGVSGRLTSPSLDLFGWGTGAYPSYSFSLDPRVEGFRLPAVTFQRGAGVGFAWQSGYMVAPNLSAFAGTTVLPSRYPTSRLALAWSRVPPTRATGWILPQTDLGERFRTGWLDNVYVRSPETEERWLGAKRRTIALVATANESPTARRTDPDTITKPWDLAFEASDRLHPRLAAYGQIRVQQIRLRPSDPERVRGLAQATTLSGPHPIGDGLAGRIRLDAFGTTGAGTDGYAWGRAAASVEWRPDRKWTLGLQATAAGSLGRPGLEIDPLMFGNAVMARATYDHGPYRASLLYKYDYRQRRWHGTEYAASFVAGSFQPFVEARLYPREYRLGVRLRLDDFFAKLRDRDPAEEARLRRTP